MSASLPAGSGRARGYANPATQVWDTGDFGQDQGLDNVCHALRVRARIYERHPGGPASLDYGPANGVFVHILHDYRGVGHFEAIDPRRPQDARFWDEGRHSRPLRSHMIFGPGG